MPGMTDAWLAGVYSNMGASLINTGKLAEARDCYEKALRLDPESARAYVNLGILVAKCHELARARQCFEEAIELDPDYAPSYYNLGLVLEGSDAAAAEHLYQTALSLDPDYAPAYSALGRDFLRHGDRSRAIEYFQRALDRDPGLVTARRGLTVARQPQTVAHGGTNSEPAAE